MIDFDNAEFGTVCWIKSFDGVPCRVILGDISIKAAGKTVESRYGIIEGYSTHCLFRTDCYATQAECQEAIDTVKAADEIREQIMSLPLADLRRLKQLLAEG